MTPRDNFTGTAMKVGNAEGESYREIGGNQVFIPVTNAKPTAENADSVFRGALEKEVPDKSLYYQV